MKKGQSLINGQSLKISRRYADRLEIFVLLGLSRSLVIIFQNN
jgi:hypothetical protein